MEEILKSLLIVMMITLPTTTTSFRVKRSPQDQPETEFEFSAEETQTSTTPSPPTKVHSKLITSTSSMFRHLTWGEPGDRLYIHNSSRPHMQTFSGYGPCSSRKPIYFDLIKNSRSLKDISAYYADLLRFYCKSEIVARLDKIFTKGYVNLDPDNSVTFSPHSFIFIKSQLTPAEYDELEMIVNLAAFSQVYVGFSNYPVNAIDPLGYDLPERCFIEIVARLHAIDLLKTVAARHISKLSYEMAIWFKLTLTEFHTEYLKLCERAVDTYDDKVILKRDLYKQCVSASMGLFEFLLKQQMVQVKEKTKCAHEAFKEFYVPKYNSYREKIGKLSGVCKETNVD